jgi:hypothetical protein
MVAERPADKLRAWFAHPAWRPAGAPVIASSSAPSRETFHKYDARISKRVAGYVFAHFLLLSAAGGAFMSFAEHASPSELALPAVVVLFSALALGGLIEQRRWALPVDVARQLAALGLLASYLVERFDAGVALAMLAALLVVLVGLFALCRPDRT